MTSADSRYAALRHAAPQTLADASFMVDYELTRGIPGDASDLVRSGPAGLVMPAPDDGQIGAMTVFDGARGPRLRDVALPDIADGIRTSGNLAREIDACRKAFARGGKQDPEYKARKNRLPAFTASGEFGERHRAIDLITHSGAVIVDVDGIDAATVRTRLGALRESALAFSSPSGDGCKAVVCVNPIPADQQQHRAAALYVFAVFQQYLGLDVDTAGTDVNRLCFMSSDADAIYRPDYLRLPWRPAPAVKRQSHATGYRPADSDREEWAWNASRGVRELIALTNDVDADHLRPVGKAIRWFASAGVLTDSMRERLIQTAYEVHDDDQQHNWRELIPRWFDAARDSHTESEVTE